jgi:hypothetical protein
MSSISALSSGQYAYSSPLQRLEAELQSEASAGTISSSDQSALSSALTSINDSLTSGQSSSSDSQPSGFNGGNGDVGPGNIKSKISSLIQAQVSSGALTSSQGTELQNLFSTTFDNGPGDQGGSAGSNGGPPPSLPLGPYPSGSGSSASSLSGLGSAIDQLLNGSPPSTSTDASSGNSSADNTSLSNVLKDFLKLLQDAQSYSYGANGTAATSGSNGSTLINYQA